MPHRYLLPALLALLAGCSVAEPAHSLPASAPPAARAQKEQARPLRVLALGASDVVGVGAGDPAREGWAPVLARTLPGGADLRRLGLSGAKAADLRAKLLPEAVAAAPDVAIVWTGVNDLAAGVPLGTFEADLGAIVGGLRATGAKVHVVNLPDVHRLPAFADRAFLMRLVLGRWQAAVRDVAGAHGARSIELADYTTELLAHPEYLSRDGLHPSPAGHRRLAEIFAKAIGS